MFECIIDSIQLRLAERDASILPAYFYQMAEAVGLTTPYDQTLAVNVISAKRIYTVNIQAYNLQANQYTYQNPLLISTTDIETFSSGLLIINLYDSQGYSNSTRSAYRSLIPTIIIPNMSKFSISVDTGKDNESYISTAISGYASALFETTSNQLKIYGYTSFQAYLWLNITILILS